MKMKISRKTSVRIKIKDLTFAGILFVSILPFLLKWFGLQERFSSVTCSMITLTVLLGCYLLNFNQVSSSNQIIILVMNIISLLFSLLLYGNYGVVTVHINMLLMLFLFNNMTFSRKQCLWIHILQALFIFLWIQTLNTELMWKSFVYESSGLYVNPCTLAIMTLSCFCHFFIVVYAYKPKSLFLELFFMFWY